MEREYNRSRNKYLYVLGTSALLFGATSGISYNSSQKIDEQISKNSLENIAYVEKLKDKKHLMGDISTASGILTAFSSILGLACLGASRGDL